MMGRTSLILAVLILGQACNGIPAPQSTGSTPPATEKISESKFPNLFKEGIDHVKKILIEVREVVGNIDQLMDDLEKEFQKLVTELGSVVKEAIDSARGAIETNRNMIADLRDARIELRKLAIDTTLKTKKMITLLRGWDTKYTREQRMKMFKRQLKILQQLVDKSRPILKTAEDTYRKALRTSTDVQNQMSDFEVAVKAALDRLAQQKDDSINTARLIINGVGKAVGAVLTSLDSFGNVCSGKCKAAAGIVDIAAYSIEQITVASLKSNMGDLSESVKTAIASVNTIMETSKKISDFIVAELKLILEWGVQVENVQEELNEFRNKPKDEVDEALSDFDELPLFRDIFRENLEGLRDVAALFLDMPIIFGDGKNLKEDIEEVAA